MEVKIQPIFILPILLYFSMKSLLVEGFLLLFKLQFNLKYIKTYELAYGVKHNWYLNKDDKLNKMQKAEYQKMSENRKI